MFLSMFCCIWKPCLSFVFSFGSNMTPSFVSVFACRTKIFNWVCFCWINLVRFISIFVIMKNSRFVFVQRNLRSCVTIFHNICMFLYDSIVLIVFVCCCLIWSHELIFFVFVCFSWNHWFSFFVHETIDFSCSFFKMVV